MSILYGIDKEIASKMAEKYDPVREKEAQDWIEQVTGKTFKSELTFQENLKDGNLLCLAANAVFPDINLKPSSSKIAFKQMENISSFLRELSNKGVPSHDQFQTVDLYENKNMIQVIDTIFALSRTATASGFKGPKIGPKLADKQEYNFTQEQLNQGKHILTLQTSGNLNGANQSGMSFGVRREVSNFKE